MSQELTYSSKFEGCMQPVAGIDGSTICANQKWMAMPWKGAGGALVVHGASDFTNFNKIKSLPMIIGHKGPI